MLAIFVYMRPTLLVLCLASLTLSANALAADTTARPKIRAITGFVDIDPKNYASQLQETVTFLNQAREAYKNAGWVVSGVRITTQPFPLYTRGLSHDEAMELLRNMSDLAGKLKFGMNIGPAMVKDNDDTKSVDLLAEALSSGLRFNGNLTAGDDGIHWTAIQQAAHLIKYVSEHSPHGQGNFNFGAIAMMKPYGPFYPGSYSGGGRHFAIGLEGTSVVAEVFAKDRDPRTAERVMMFSPRRFLVIWLPWRPLPRKSRLQTGLGSIRESTPPPRHSAKIQSALPSNPSLEGRSAHRELRRPRRSSRALCSRCP